MQRTRHEPLQQQPVECWHVAERPITGSCLLGDKLQLVTVIHCGFYKSTRPPLLLASFGASAGELLEVAGPPPGRPSGAARETPYLALRREQYVSSIAALQGDILLYWL